MSNTNKLINILLLVIVITVILFVSSPVLNNIHTNNDLDIKYNEYVKLNDSLNNEIRILNETTKRLNIVIDSSRSNIKIIERIKYEKINNIKKTVEIKKSIFVSPSNSMPYFLKNSIISSFDCFLK